MNEVVLKRLEKSYGRGALVLRGIDLEIARGEFLVLVGPSGCGKSTLLRSIAGLEEVTAGEIHIASRKVNDVPPAERDIGMVFQDYALYPHMTVRENLAFGLKQRRLPRTDVDTRVHEAADMLGLRALLDRKPSQLSGGQRQRVAIGRAVVKRPKVFLFDEPLSNLDAQLRSQTRVELAALHRRLGSTSIYVTHDQVEAMTLADRIVVMEKGSVRQVGAPLELYRRPANRFVAGFIGSPGMNFISGELKLDGEFRFPGGVLRFRPDEVPRYAGDAVLGARAESIALEPDGTSNGESGILGRIVLVELHGHETHVLVDIGRERTWTVRVPGTFQLPSQRNIRLKLDRRALHWFSEGAEGERLEVAPSRPTPRPFVHEPPQLHH